MAKRATTQEVLNTAREIAISKPSKASLNPSELHVRKTFESLMRSGRTKSENPKYATLCDRSYAQFRDWSLRNGFSLDAELELLGKHRVAGTKIVREKVNADEHGLPEWWRVTRVILITEDEMAEIPEFRWVTDYEAARWVSHDNLARRKKKFLLTAYGRKRFQTRRKPLNLELEGEKKSASAWAEDYRCRVSDKVLKARKEKGWSDADAILTPPRQKPGDR
jgi:hypothetical protein